MSPSQSATGDDAVARQRVSSCGFAHPTRRASDKPRRVALVVEISQHRALKREARHRGGDGLVECVFKIIPDVRLHLRSRPSSAHFKPEGPADLKPEVRFDAKPHAE